jgi:hypothetical protein
VWFFGAPFGAPLFLEIEMKMSYGKSTKMKKTHSAGKQMKNTGTYSAKSKKVSANQTHSAASKRHK